MVRFDFDDPNKYFGPFFQAKEDLKIKGNYLVISPDEKIRVYEKGSLIEKFASFCHRTVVLTIGNEEIICNKNSFFKNIHVKPNASDDAIKKAFARDVLGSTEISNSIRTRSQDAAQTNLALTIRWDTVSGTKEQIEMLFDVLKAARISASSDEIEYFIKDNSSKRDDTITIRIEPLKKFVQEHLDSDKAIENFQYDAVFADAATKITKLLDRLSEKPAVTPAIPAVDQTSPERGGRSQPGAPEPRRGDQTLGTPAGIAVVTPPEEPPAAPREETSITPAVLQEQPDVLISEKSATAVEEPSIGVSTTPPEESPAKPVEELFTTVSTPQPEEPSAIAVEEPPKALAATPAEQPRINYDGLPEVLLNEQQGRQFFELLQNHGIRAKSEDVDAFLQRSGFFLHTLDPKEIHLFILEHFERGVDRIDSDAIRAFFRDKETSPDLPMANFIIGLLERAPLDRALMQKDLERFLASSQGKALANEISTMQKIAAHIFVHLPDWQRELEKAQDYQVPFQGIKITKQISGLPYGISVVYNQDTKSSELLIKVKGVEGKGSYKRVMFPVTWTSEKEVAFSVLHKNVRAPENKKELEKEGEFHRKAAGCANVVQGKLAKFIKWPPGALNDRSVSILYEKMNMGGLGDLLKKKQQFTPGQLKQIALGAASGVDQLHHLDPPIILEDIKPDNILLHSDDKGNIIAKVADLGLSREGAAQHTKFTGSPLFMSNEKYFGAGDGDGRDDDMWALGITYYCLRHSRYPPVLEGLTDLSQLETALLLADRIRGDQPPVGTFDHLIWLLLDPDPETRIKSDQVVAILRQLDVTAFA